MQLSDFQQRIASLESSRTSATVSSLMTALQLPPREEARLGLADFQPPPAASPPTAAAASTARSPFREALSPAAAESPP